MSSNTAIESTANSVAAAYTLVVTWPPTCSSRWKISSGQRERLPGHV